MPQCAGRRGDYHPAVEMIYAGRWRETANWGFFQVEHNGITKGYVYRHYDRYWCPTCNRELELNVRYSNNQNE